jgi:hypothetical protein
MKLKQLIELGVIEPETQKQYEAAPATYKVIHTPKACEDCDMLCTNRTIKHRFYQTIQNRLHQGHWKTYCSVCNLYLNPETGKFDSTRTECEAALLRIFS